MNLSGVLSKDYNHLLVASAAISVTILSLWPSAVSAKKERSNSNEKTQARTLVAAAYIQHTDSSGWTLGTMRMLSTMFTVWKELRSCVKVEVAVLGSCP